MTYRHSSGDTDGTCDACAAETFGYDRPLDTLCTDPHPEAETGDAASWCAVCGHNVEMDEVLRRARYMAE